MHRKVVYTLYNQKWERMSFWEYKEGEDGGMKHALESMLDCACDYNSSILVEEEMRQQNEIVITRKVVMVEETRHVIGAPQFVLHALGIDRSPALADEGSE